MKKNFVQFFSPGTFVSETSTREIDIWDTSLAVKMSKEIKERHGSRPYGFRFIERERGDGDFDSHISGESGMYYLGGTVYTLEEIEKAGNPDQEILLANMKGNGWDRVICNKNSWEIWLPFLEGDVCLETTDEPRN